MFADCLSANFFHIFPHPSQENGRPLPLPPTPLHLKLALPAILPSETNLTTNILIWIVSHPLAKYQKKCRPPQNILPFLQPSFMGNSPASSLSGSDENRFDHLRLVTRFKRMTPS